MALKECNSTFSFRNLVTYFFSLKLPLLVLSQAPDLSWLEVAWVLSFAGPLPRSVVVIRFVFQARESHTTGRCRQTQKVGNASLIQNFKCYDSQYSVLDGLIRYFLPYAFIRGFCLCQQSYFQSWYNSLNSWNSVLDVSSPSNVSKTVLYCRSTLRNQINFFLCFEKIYGTILSAKCSWKTPGNIPWEILEFSHNALYT